MSKNQNNIKDFHVLHDNIIIKQIVIESVDKVIRPNKYEDKAELGEVVAVGPGRTTEDGKLLGLSIRTGDVVYFNKYLATKVKIGSDEFHLIKEEDVVMYKR